MTEHMSIIADKSRVEIQILEVRDAPARLLDGYHAGFTKTFFRAPENVSWIPLDGFVRPNRVIAVAVEEGVVTAGLYYDRIEEAGQPIRYFKGMWSTSSIRGLATGLTRDALAYECQATGEHVGALAVIRIRADGRANPGAAKVFGRLGFHPRAYMRVPLTPSEEHRHLIPTANRIDENGAAFDVLEMVMSPSDVGRLLDR